MGYFLELGYVKYFYFYLVLFVNKWMLILKYNKIDVLISLKLLIYWKFEKLMINELVEKIIKFVF